MSQMSLLEWQPTFHGAAFDAARDQKRLTGQLLDIFSLMRDGKWRTVEQIHTELGYPHTSISAQLRNLRKPENGGYTVEREHLGNALYAYRLLVKESRHQD